MKNIKYIVSGLVVLIAVLAVGVYIGHKTAPVYTLKGVDSATYFTPTFEFGGYELINQSTTTYTLQSTDVQNFTTLGLLGSSTAASTFTLPASSTLAGWFNNVGDNKLMTIFNASTTGQAITLAGGTGTILEDASSSKTLIGGATATVLAYKRPSGDYVFTIDVAN